jgi:hypothetical protein
MYYSYIQVSKLVYCTRTVVSDGALFRHRASTCDDVSSHALRSCYGSYEDGNISLGFVSFKIWTPLQMLLSS